jgi:hypothetical protein
MTRFGELCSFLETKKIIRPRISKARMARAIMRGTGRFPKAGNVPELTDWEAVWGG